MATVEQQISRWQKKTSKNVKYYKYRMMYSIPRKIALQNTISLFCFALCNRTMHWVDIYWYLSTSVYVWECNLHWPKSFVTQSKIWSNDKNDKLNGPVMMQKRFRSQLWTDSFCDENLNSNYRKVFLVQLVYSMYNRIEAKFPTTQRVERQIDCECGFLLSFLQSIPDTL